MLKLQFAALYNSKIVCWSRPNEWCVFHFSNCIQFKPATMTSWTVGVIQVTATFTVVDMLQSQLWTQHWPL